MCAAASVWGNNLHLSIFGESHGPAIGLVLDGLPAGIKAPPPGRKPTSPKFSAAFSTGLPRVRLFAS